MREAMAGRWLGFEREQARAWYETAGPRDVEVDCAAIQEGQALALSVFVAYRHRARPGLGARPACWLEQAQTDGLLREYPGVTNAD